MNCDISPTVIQIQKNVNFQCPKEYVEKTLLDSKWLNRNQTILI